MDITIRPLMMDDYQSVFIWSKDEDFCAANGWEQGQHADEIYHWWYNCVNHTPDNFIRMGIEFHGKLVGYVDLADIDGNTAELGIAIGDSAVWGKGIGTQAILSIMDYGSKNFGITCFHAETHEVNHRARKLIEKLGFEELGRTGTEEYMGSTSGLIQYRLMFPNNN